MSSVKSLLGQTAIYGLPTIVGRLLNYFLVPLYTSESVFKNPADYGVISELYAWVAFLIILLPLGMETAFFRFFNEKEDKDAVFRSSFITVIGFNIIFFIVLLFASQSIADAMMYSEHPEFIVLLGAIVCVDAIAALPMAKLRSENKALRFSTIHFTAIAVNVGLNLFLMLVVFNPEKPMEGVLFILLANLLASCVKLVGTYKDFLNLKWKYNKELALEMLRYSFPLIIAGFAGIVNETLDRIMMKPLLIQAGNTPEYSLEQVGIYSACYKLAMIVAIFLQAYRYAAEPFFFAQSKNEDRNKVYIKIMNYFVAAVCLVFIGVSLNIDIFKYFIRSEEYWSGLYVVPILLLANVFLGIYYNQSIWYKLSGQTKFGAYIAIGGGAITILVNMIFIPLYGFEASAWATLIVYGLQMVASYLLGQKYYPIKYNLRKFGLYFGLALGLFFIAQIVDMDPNEFTWAKFFFHNSLILLYVFVVWFMEKPSKLTVNR
ncbi:MAG: oligosaccharide flippase family protein [Crocinitomicaceae bacterium]|nr:oligosaccharide flippase family protein [Crocinitomicaceae bacterium]MDP5098847.1 oligosaccharide flippase family protein [Crocinitomicaceae bacterium]